MVLVTIDTVAMLRGVHMVGERIDIMNRIGMNKEDSKVMVCRLTDVMAASKVDL